MNRPLEVGEEPPPMTIASAAEMASKRKSRKGTADRFSMMNTFIDCTMKDLKRSEIAVWWILFRDTRDGIVRASFDVIATRAGCDRRNVGRALKRLEALGLVKVIFRGG